MASKFQPALFGGIVLGVLSALPIVSMGNMCCCLWVLSGGALAAFLLQRGQAAPISVADGAVVGLLAGLIGACVSTVLAIPFALMMGPFQAGLAERVLENARDLPEGLRPFLETVGKSPALGLLGILGQLVFSVVIGAIFSTLGGLIGAALFGKKGPRADSPTGGPVGA